MQVYVKNSGSIFDCKSKVLSLTKHVTFRNNNSGISAFTSGLSWITEGWREGQFVDEVISSYYWVYLQQYAINLFGKKIYSAKHEYGWIWKSVNVRWPNKAERALVWGSDLKRICQYLGYLPSVFSKYSLSSMISFLVLPTCAKLEPSIYLLPCSMSKMRCAAIRNKTQSPANMRRIETIPRKLLKDIICDVFS